jgi:hypothetical protein
MKIERTVNLQIWIRNRSYTNEDIEIIDLKMSEKIHFEVLLEKKNLEN